MEYQAISLTEGVWAIEDGKVRMYLLDAGAEAILIDTGYGSGNLRGIVNSLIGDKTVRVVNTHLHGDHISGNGQFDHFYIGAEDLNAIRPACPLKAKITEVKDGDRITVGDTTLDVVGIPGHTPGSIALLDKHRRLLFSSDAVACHFPIYMQYPNQDIKRYLSSLKNLKAMSPFYDRICPCHGDLQIDKDSLDRVIRCCEGILAGMIEGVLEEMDTGEYQRTYHYKDIAIYY